MVDLTDQAFFWFSCSVFLFGVLFGMVIVVVIVYVDCKKKPNGTNDGYECEVRCYGKNGKLKWHDKFHSLTPDDKLQPTNKEV